MVFTHRSQQRFHPISSLCYTKQWLHWILGMIAYYLSCHGTSWWNYFLNYNDWEFHQSVEILNIWWTEIKRLRKYAMLMIPDYLSFFNINFCLGCFYCISGGLMRFKRQRQSEQDHVDFPSLYSMKIGSVTTKLASVLCAIFPKILGDRCPQHIIKPLQEKITGKSLCQASITRAAYREYLSIL